MGKGRVVSDTRSFFVDKDTLAQANMNINE